MCSDGKVLLDLSFFPLFFSVHDLCLIPTNVMSCCCSALHFWLLICVRQDIVSMFFRSHPCILLHTHMECCIQLPLLVLLGSVRSWPSSDSISGWDLSPVNGIAVVAVRKQKLWKLMWMKAEILATGSSCSPCQANTSLRKRSWCKACLSHKEVSTNGWSDTHLKITGW